MLTNLAQNAWRRPVTSDEVDDLVTLYNTGAAGEDSATGLALAMQGVVEATGTLYRTELGDPGQTGQTIQLSQWEIASQLSYLATGGPPDEELRQAALSGSLIVSDVRVGQLQRLLGTPAAVTQLGSFVEEWLGLTNMSSLQKNNEYFPLFTTTLRDDMAASARAFTAAVISNSNASVPELLSADYTYADNPLAAFLDSTQQPGDMMARLSTTDLPRRGLITHPAFLSTYAHADDGSPTLRGKLVRTRLLCQDIPPPPPNVIASVAAVSSTQTTRQRAEAHTSNPTCSGCHNLMDPIGFGLEGFDGFGQARTMESGQTIDDSGNIMGSDIAGAFTGGVELATRLASSKDVGTCAATQLTRFALGRIETPADQCTLNLTISQYQASTGSLKWTAASKASVAMRRLREENGVPMNKFQLPEHQPKTIHGARSRRSFLKLMAGAGTMAGFTRSLWPSVCEADTPSPLRFVALWTQHGRLDEFWVPQGGETDFDINFQDATPQALQPYRDQLLILDGLDYKVLYEYGTSGHDGGPVTFLTGSQLNTSSGDSLPNSISLDQYLAGIIGGATQFRSLQLNTYSAFGGQGTGDTLSFSDGGVRVPWERDLQRASLLSASSPASRGACLRPPTCAR